MTTQIKSMEIRALGCHEIEAVTGGMMAKSFVSPTAGMPDRIVGGCGTMWILDRILKGMTGGR